MNSDLIAARANLWKAQERFGYKPELGVMINDFHFNMDSSESNVPIHIPGIVCTMPDQLLSDILARRVHWNNCEVGCLITFDRSPNIYLPDFHLLMSFFHVPAVSNAPSI